MLNILPLFFNACFCFEWQYTLVAYLGFCFFQKREESLRGIPSANLLLFV